MSVATVARREPGLRRRWDRQVLRIGGMLDGEHADRILPWILASGAFVLLVALDAAAIRSIDGGPGLSPWVQAAWRRDHGWSGRPIGGVDPARATWSFASEPILWLARFVPPEAVFSVVQAAAIAVAIIPLWRLARDEARLRVGATVVVTAAYVMAPALQRANLTAFHPELIALPALVWAYRLARQGHWKRYGALVLLVLCCRADLGLTVAAMGLLLMSEGRRRPGIATAVVGLGWSIVAVIALAPTAPSGRLTPAEEFVSRATAPLAVMPRLVTHPVSEIKGIVAEPAVLFLVVVLAPLLFLPLVSPRKLAVAMPGLVLAMIADRSVQGTAASQVLDLAPAAAHIAPSMSFVFIALVFALERIGELSVTRVNVDRRVLIALLAGSTLFFVTDAPSSPYQQPWAWGSQDKLDGARQIAARRVGERHAVAVSPAATVLLADRAHVVELPPDPHDFTPARVRQVSDQVEVVLLDTTAVDRRTGTALWTVERRRRILARFEDAGLEPVYQAERIYLLRR